MPYTNFKVYVTYNICFKIYINSCVAHKKLNLIYFIQTEGSDKISFSSDGKRPLFLRDDGRFFFFLDRLFPQVQAYTPVVLLTGPLFTGGRAASPTHKKKYEALRRFCTVSTARHAPMW
jgi:hypothetical protein